MKKKFLILMLLTVLFTSLPVFAQNTICPGDDEEYMVTISACTNSGGIATKCGIPAGLADMINDAYNLLKIAVPIVLIVLGMIDMFKAVASQKEDEIKKGWSTLVKRTIYGVAVFFVFFLIQLIISLLPSSSGKDTILSCTKQFFVKKTYGVCCIKSGANANGYDNKYDGSNKTDGKGNYEY